MNNWIIYTIGFIAQILFSSRLLIQWLYSEQKNTIITPNIFFCSE